ncbi:hypothetical protein TBLA_0D00200 [Henningerozyma blattae CBS 6284]|uniref:Ribosome assembly protein 1 n=1 Tax=Henningerozyma blattae (strain ATCC 34711 / CBS 6284 / DSM 70876 / NBRC 10599 / NRRL Y-10934 / UCD 77-7) TaxID=1071380 RepID=I2H2C8_HENB6|nr:hypothetical protein TBLA_0D00200 [Tetrapisispora blattae CBS 6284]CCH60530.1 hypothetical protein TBLA_0D00200 [Tetrapisispora blattae CBS 6284]
MPKVGPETFKKLQNDPSCIRNICIVAHVDHGKTSLSDSLLASNGIISQRLAGKVRYLDSRPDEQLRGITMESSAISLYFRVLHKNEQDEKNPIVNEHLINLIDSPGHIDFASEVSTASRLCDGAVVLVDVVEGVCSQTVTVLRQCWTEKLKPILVLNKIDRLIVELQLTPMEAYLHLTKIIEQVNSVIGSFFAGQRQLDDYSWRQQLETDSSATFVDSDDSELYFDPIKNNVIFASAIDGWGFNIGQLAKFYQSKLGAKREVLQKVLWGDYYLDPKTKKILTSKNLKNKNTNKILNPLFVSLILDNIWKIYSNTIIEKNLDMIEKISKTLNIKLLPRDLKSKDDKQLLKTIMSQWLPVSTSVLLTVIEHLPSPLVSQEKRLDTILGSNINENKIDSNLLASLKACDKDGPVTAYVSKILSIPRIELPIENNSNDSNNGFANDARMEAIKAAKRAEMIEKLSNLEINKESQEQNSEKNDEYNNLYERATDKFFTPEISLDNKISASSKRIREVKEERINDEFKIITEPSPLFEYEQEEGEEIIVDNDFLVPEGLDPNDPLANMFEYEEEEEDTQLNIANIDDNSSDASDDIFDEKDEVLIGFCRIYSGTLKVAQTIKIIGPKYDVKQEDEDNEEYTELTTITHLYLFMGKELVPLDECPSGNIVGIRGITGKILKNGTIVSPEIKGINFGSVNLTTKPIVRVALEPSNPMEMNKLVRGLKLLNQADPCVETFVSDNGEHILCTAGELHLERCLKDLRERFAQIEISSSKPAIPYRETFIKASENKNEDVGKGEVRLDKYKIGVRSFPLPREIVEFIENHEIEVKELYNGEDLILKENFIKKFQEVLDKIKEQGNDIDVELRNDDFIKKIVVFGPRRIGSNILICQDELMEGVFRKSCNTTFEYSESIINGFELSTLEGPLAKEVVQGMCVCVEYIKVMEEEDEEAAAVTAVIDISGRLITSTRDVIHESFLQWSPRMMWAIYSCDIQSSIEVLGKVYAVIQQRKGIIISEEMKEGTPFFQIESHIPVVEAFGFSEDIRKKTSGAAQPQLIFAGFEIIDIDPFWVPTTEEELEELGDVADRENPGRKHMNLVRRRKGLFVDEKVVENAEKQRTLKRN